MGSGRSALGTEEGESRHKFTDTSMTLSPSNISIATVLFLPLVAQQTKYRYDWDDIYPTKLGIFSQTWN